MNLFVWRELMERLFVRKKIRLSAESDPRFFLVCLATFCGALWFTVIRNSVAVYITSLGVSLGVKPVLPSVTVCLLLLVAAYFSMSSTAALVMVPCICAACGFAAQSATYTYGGASVTDPDFLIFALLIFAYNLSVLYVATYAMKLSKSIQSYMRSNRALKAELHRYQIMFVLIVTLLIVSGYFILI